MKKILIVDDSLFTRNIHKQIIEEQGYLTLEADGGETAIEVFKAEKPDLVMMDLMMPNMDGIDVIKKIFEIDPKALTIVCSTDRQTSRQQEAKEIGVKKFLTKPLDAEKLSEALTQIFNEQP